MQLRKATRQKVKVRLGFSAVSGGGKTISALLVAYGMIGDWSKIAVIDTENDSADLYANHTLPSGVTIGEFQKISLEAPYSPERYIQAIKACENEGMEIIIIDSITHEWEGKGGCLDIHSCMSGNSYTNWAAVTPRHQAFIDAILKSKCHVFTTVRRKQDYEMTKDSTGKLKVEKAGLKEITREGFDYELTANIELDMKHNATALKDRTGLFADKPVFVPSVETGQMLAAWCETGIAPIDPKEELNKAISDLSGANNVDELSILKSGLPNHIVINPEFKSAAMIRYNQLKAAA